MKHSTLIILSFLLLLSFYPNNDRQTKEIDYNDPMTWFTDSLSTHTEREIDVFYIAPTSVWDRKDSLGNIFHNMDIYNDKQRNQLNRSIVLGRTVFGDSCNFFSPYYRQVSMNSWLTLDSVLIEDRYKLALQDITQAFDHYMKHFNHGRPFILAGHSQGAKGVIDLLKNRIDSNNKNKLVAAYAIGFSVSRNELKQYAQLKPAQDSIDIGVLIGFNSVSHPEANIPMFRYNEVCINPLNWKTDSTIAWSNEGFSAYVDQRSHLLIVKGLDETKYFTPSVATLLPLGNFHIYEYNLYMDQLKNNVLQRMRSYKKINGL